MKYIIGRSNHIEQIEFEMSLQRSLISRINNSFIKTYKPIIDDAPYRIFDLMSDYRKWCREKLPAWLGYAE